MVIRKKIFLCLLLLAGLSTQLSVGYGLYLENRFVGIVHNRAEAHAIVDILLEDLPLASPKSALYLRLLPKGGFSTPTELLENAKAAGGFTTEFSTENIAVPFSTESVASSSLLVGQTKVQTPGQDGVRTVVRAITRKEGEIVKEEILSDTVTTFPVTEVVAIGTKPKEPGIGTGSFSLPLSVISVSSGFGTRWNRQHAGVDFAADAGTHILAADTGTVVFSGECDGYGKLLILDHKNGFSTYYAHCSVLYAAEGTTPEKGEVIAEVGSTGNSTGPHLHFEIRKDSVPIDPTSLLPQTP